MGIEKATVQANVASLNQAIDNLEVPTQLNDISVQLQNFIGALRIYWNTEGGSVKVAELSAIATTDLEVLCHEVVTMVDELKDCTVQDSYNAGSLTTDHIMDLTKYL